MKKPGHRFLLSVPVHGKQPLKRVCYADCLVRPERRSTSSWKIYVDAYRGLSIAADAATLSGGIPLDAHP